MYDWTVLEDVSFRAVSALKIKKHKKIYLNLAG
jgi:hypothetical protein